MDCSTSGCSVLEAADSLIASLICQAVIWVREQVKDKALMNYAVTWVCLPAASGAESMAMKDWLSQWSQQGWAMEQALWVMCWRTRSYDFWRLQQISIMNDCSCSVWFYYCLCFLILRWWQVFFLWFWISNKNLLWLFLQYIWKLSLKG